MAERSFVNEVERLRLGAGDEFRGGRILATDRLGMDTSDTHQRGALKFDQATAAALRQRGRTAD